MSTRITKRDILKNIAEKCADDEVIVAYCAKEIASMDAKNEKRKSAPKKPTKAQLEAEALKPSVINALTAEGKTVKEIADTIGVNFQKVTPILKALIAEGIATSETVKGKNLYRVAGE